MDFILIIICILVQSKLSPVRAETPANRSRVEPMTVTMPPALSEPEYRRRVAELSAARGKYGAVAGIPSITLRNGVEMPVLALGTALLDPRLLPHIISAAVELGFRAFDTAYVYGNERAVGAALRAKIEDGTVKRSDLFIISKLWSTFHAPTLVLQAARASLDALGLDYFDLYLIHNPMSFKEGGEAVPRVASVVQYSEHDYLDAWRGLERVAAAGLTRALGVSNFNSVQVQRVLDKGTVPPTVNQVECHPRLSQRRLAQYCAARGVALSCFGVLGRGELADPLVAVLAAGLNITAAQLLISYQLSAGRGVVVKASSGAHLHEALAAAASLGTSDKSGTSDTLGISGRSDTSRAILPSAAIEALHAMNDNSRRYTFHGMGDTHKNYPFNIPF